MNPTLGLLAVIFAIDIAFVVFQVSGVLFLGFCVATALARRLPGARSHANSLRGCHHRL